MHFANSCLAPLTINVVMKFGQGYIDMNNNFRFEPINIYLRECYPQIFENVSKRAGLFQLGVSKQFILGTPGIGKSLLRMYFCHRLLALSQVQSRNAFIIFQKGKGDKYTYVVRKLESSVQAELLIYPDTDIMSLSKSIKRWETTGSIVVSLVDVSEGNYLLSGYSSPRANHSVYFSSPNDKLFAEADRVGKESQGVDLYMPVWSLEELQKAAPLVVPLVTYKQVELMYNEFGGVARVALGGEIAVIEARAKLNDRVEEFKVNPKLFIDAVFQSKIAGEKSGPTKSKNLLPANISQAFLHVTSKDLAFQEPFYQWASPVILAQVASHLLFMNANAADQYINDDYSGGAKGELVERLWLDRFKLACCARSESNLMTIKVLGNDAVISPVDMHRLLTGIKCIQEVWHLKDSMKEGLEVAIKQVNVKVWQGDSAILLRSLSSSLDAIDAILVIKRGRRALVLYLQVTLAAHHPINGVRATVFLENLIQIAKVGKAESALLFLVPKHRFTEFTRQTVDVVSADSLTQYAILPGALLNDKEAKKAATAGVAKRKKNKDGSGSNKRKKN